MEGLSSDYFEGVYLREFAVGCGVLRHERLYPEDAGFEQVLDMLDKLGEQIDTNLRKPKTAAELKLRRILKEGGLRTQIRSLVKLLSG